MNFEALSLAQREREYSPSSVIGGHYQPYLDAYAQRSRSAHEQALQAGARWQRLAYGPGPTQGIELYLPSAAGTPGALLIFFHGGYWQELSAADSRFAAAACVQAGHAFAAVDYTLAPQATVQQIVAECRAAYRLLAETAPAMGLDVRRLVVSGSSAGAHLAAMVALPSALPPQLSPPAAAVLVSGVYRLEPLVGTGINQKLGLDALSSRSVSPQLAPLAGFPPSWVCWGQHETTAFKAQSLHFAGALHHAGSRSTTFEVSGKNHFDIILDLAQPGTALGEATLCALNAAA